jgi:hypothetical protein
MAAGHAERWRPAKPSRLQLVLVGEGADFQDRVDWHRGKAGVSLFGCAPVFFIDQNHVGLNAGSLSHGPAAGLAGDNLNFAAFSPVHKSFFLQITVTKRSRPAIGGSSFFPKPA